jgi:hypothetical protein
VAEVGGGIWAGEVGGAVCLSRSSDALELRIVSFESCLMEKKKNKQNKTKKTLFWFYNIQTNLKKKKKKNKEKKKRRRRHP